MQSNSAGSSSSSSRPEREPADEAQEGLEAEGVEIDAEQEAEVRIVSKPVQPTKAEREAEWWVG